MIYRVSRRVRIARSNAAKHLVYTSSNKSGNRLVDRHAVAYIR